MTVYRDKLVLLTGASSGLGRELARAYHAEGARLALVARRAELLDELCGELGGPDAARAYPADLTKTGSIPGMVEAAVRDSGRDVDVLVHCAGASCSGEAERTPFEEIEAMTALNYLAGVRLAQCVLPAMKRRRAGQIVWIGSGSAYRGMPRAAAYSASKAAARNFCEGLRSELVPFGVGVLSVVPGALKTDFHRNQKNYSEDRKLRVTGTPSETAPLARAIVRAGRLGRSEIDYGRNTWLGRHLAYWAPGLLDRLIRSRLG